MRLILREARQRGSLYHFTTPRRLDSILDANILRGGYDTVSGNERFISLTRDRNFPKISPYAKSNNSFVGLELDGDRLSDTYRIGPIDYFYSEGSRGETRGMGPEGLDAQAEERVHLGGKMGIENIRKYIKSIVIYRAGLSEDDANFAEDIATERDLPVIYI